MPRASYLVRCSAVAYTGLRPISNFSFSKNLPRDIANTNKSVQPSSNDGLTNEIKYFQCGNTNLNLKCEFASYNLALLN